MEVSAAWMDHGCRLPRDARVSHAYLHALIESNPVAVVVLDSSHGFQMCNAAFTRLFQYDPTDLESWGIDALIASPEFLGEAGEATHAVLLGNQVCLRSKRRRRDGLLVDVEIYGVPLLLDGCVQGVFGLYQEVTACTERTGVMQGMAIQLPCARDERQPRARDLHGSLSLELSLLSWQLNRLEKLIPQEDEAAKVLQRTRELATLCGDQVRSVGEPALRENRKPHPSGTAFLATGTASSRSQCMTVRETEIVRLLAMGLSSKEVASRLEIGTRTVDTHRANVYRKLQLRNVADLVMYAIRNGLLPLDE